MQISGKQVAAARELLGLSQVELAAAVGIDNKTVHRFESGSAEPRGQNLEKIRHELETRGIDFTNGEGPGVRLNTARAEQYARQHRSAEV